MSAADRKHQRFLVLAIVATTPLLAAPYFPGCAHSQGAYPTLCTPGTGSTCPANDWAKLSQTEETLAEAAAAPGTSATGFYMSVSAELNADFNGMSNWSRAATSFGATPVDLPIVIQEISYPSAYDTTAANPLDYEANAIVDQQYWFVEAMHLQWQAHREADPPPPQIISLNWFNLHDFHPNLCSSSGLNWPFPFCACGLWTFDHRAKDQTTWMSGWDRFRDWGNEVNENPPPRACP